MNIGQTSNIMQLQNRRPISTNKNQYATSTQAIANRTLGQDIVSISDEARAI